MKLIPKILLFSFLSFILIGLNPIILFNPSDFTLPDIPQKINNPIKDKKEMFAVGGQVSAEWKLRTLDIPEESITENQLKLFKSREVYRIHQKLLKEIKEGPEGKPAYDVKRAFFRSLSPRQRLDYDMETAVVGALITMKDEEGNIVVTDSTDATGRFQIEVENQKTYTLIVSHDDYQTTFLKLNTKTPRPTKYSGASFNLLMYQKANTRIPKDAFLIPYSHLSFDVRSGQFLFKQNEEFRKALEQKMVVARGSALYFPDKQALEEAPLEIYKNNSLYASYNTSKKGRVVAYLPFNNEYNIVVKSTRKGYENSMINISTKVPNDLMLSDVEVGIEVRLYMTEEILKAGLKGIPLAKYYYHDKNLKLSQDLEYAKRISAILEGKATVSELLKDELLLAQGEGSVLDRINSRVKKETLNKELVEKVIAENQCQKLIRSKEIKSQWIQEKSSDKERYDVAKDHRTKIGALFNYRNHHLMAGNKNQIQRQVIEPTTYLKTFYHSYGYSESQIHKLDSYKGSIVLSKKSYYLLYIQYFKENKRIAPEDYESLVNR